MEQLFYGVAPGFQPASASERGLQDSRQICKAVVFVGTAVAVVGISIAVVVGAE